MADKKRALVVDDMAINRSLISLFLSSRGYAVETADDGLKGLNLCKANVYDLVFTDIEMPNMNGIEFLRSTKKLPGYTKVPFVVLSTLDTDAMKSKAMAFGAFHYMVKPFTNDKMTEVLNRLG